MPTIFTIDLEDKRVYGLDVLRAFAILTVVLGHSLGLLSPSGHFSIVANYFVFDGVSIFFVLSGFLIGGILIKLLETKPPSSKVLLEFWTRRWFRTLPAYYLVLCGLIMCSFLFARFADIPNRFRLPDLQFFIFTQNWSTPHPGFFPEAWSLSIEEWFYLLIPSALFLLAGALGVRPKRSVLYVAISVIVSVTLVRFYRFFNGEYLTVFQMYATFSNQVITRLDSLMFGMIGAYVSYYHKKLWISQKGCLFVAGAIVILFHRYLPKIVNIEDTGLFNCVFSFSVMSIGTLLLLPYLSNYNVKSGRLYKPLTCVSICSYSMYLLNLTAVELFGITFLRRAMGINSHLLLYVADWVMVLGGSITMYKYFEKPTTRLRERF